MPANATFNPTPRQSTTVTWSLHRGERESSPGSCYSSDCKGLFSALPPGLYLIYPNRRCLSFLPCNHSYINNSKYFSNCSASFSSTCLFSACSPAKTTNRAHVGCDWGQRQAHFLCFSRFSLAFPWVKSKGWVIAGSIMMQREQTSLFKQWQLYEA